MKRGLGITLGIIGLLIVGFVAYRAWQISAAERAFKQSVTAVNSQHYQQGLVLADRAVKLNPTARHLNGLAYAHLQLEH